MGEMNIPQDTYALERTPTETQRLQVQAGILAPATRQMCELAGITRGMRVLEIGSGAGDVAMLLAELVGPEGEVVGVEIDPVVLDTARARVRARGFTNVSFLVGNLETMLLDDEFDAIVGRLILMHVRSPVTLLRRLTSVLRPGGIVAFQEFDMAHCTTTAVHPPNQLVQQMFNWILEAFHRAGLPVRMGLDMYTVFSDAGLPAPHMRGEATIMAGPDRIWYDWGAETTRTLLPIILQAGLASAAEVDIDTLADRIREEVVSQRLVLRGPDIISAWTRKPDQMEI
jgi:ubiquinone/menaquinone biosynthesis C-methylase UbiE